MTFKKCVLLTTAFSLLLVAIIAMSGADRVVLAGPNEQSSTSTTTPVNVVGSDPREYTVDYVERAISLYNQRGLEATQAYYNSDDSFEGEWYLFAIDENDIYVIHPLIPKLIGTDIKDVIDSSGYELGKDIAKATEEGRWIEYLWPHPVTLAEVPKVSYAKRHDGYVFASGYYPVPGDPAEYTQDYVQKAIDKYESDGLTETVAHYNSRMSLDNQWYLVMTRVEDEMVLAHGLYPHLLGTNVNDLLDPEGFNVGQALLAAPENGYWFEMAFFSSQEAGFTRLNVWAVLHDGLIFASGYFTGVSGEPTPTPTPSPTSTPTPSPTPIPEELIDDDPFRFLVAVLNDAYESGNLSDILSGLLADLFMDTMITPHTGETREEIKHRLVVEGPLADRAALTALYNATDGPNWDKNDNWLTNEPLSEWYGVTTDISGRVTELEMRDNKMTGQLPAELGNLAKLTLLDLRNNPLGGNIPAELGNLENLESLVLYRTEVTGEIPNQIANLTNLERLEVWSNKLSGEIPTWLGDMSTLKTLDLDDNEFTGEIPPELGNLVNVKILWLSRNHLTGAIPPELGNLAEARYMMLFDNELSGEIPPELGSLANLKWLYISENKLTGTIPTELGNLDALERMYLLDNSLSGSIPPELGNLANLKTLYLSNNELTGSIPPELGNLSNLGWLMLHQNQLTGTIPPELGNLANLRYMFLRNNQLTGMIPPELGNLASLETLSLRNNQLTGMIPPELGNLASLEGMTLSNNQLSGDIPSELGNLSNLDSLYINGNQLTGCIPAELQDISDNDFEELDPSLPFCGSEQQMSESQPAMNMSSSWENSVPMPTNVVNR